MLAKTYYNLQQSLKDTFPRAISQEVIQQANQLIL